MFGIVYIFFSTGIFALAVANTLELVYIPNEPFGKQLVSENEETNFQVKQIFQDPMKDKLILTILLQVSPESHDIISKVCIYYIYITNIINNTNLFIMSI